MKSVALMVAVVLLVGCATTPKPTKTHSAHNMHAPATYKVKAGDTVSKIGERFGINWREISALNRLDAKHTIYVGQTLLLPKSTTSNVSTNGVAATQTKNSSASTIYAPLSARQNNSQRNHGSYHAPQPTAFGYRPSAINLNPNPSQSVNAQSSTRTKPFSHYYPVGQNNTIVRGFGQLVNDKPIQGIFFKGAAGDGVFASQKGTVQLVSTDRRPVVVVAHEDGYMSYYFDIGGIHVQEKAQVRAGDRLGQMIAQTSSGLSVFEFRMQAPNGVFIDPLPMLK